MKNDKRERERKEKVDINKGIDILNTYMFAVSKKKKIFPVPLSFTEKLHKQNSHV